MSQQLGAIVYRLTPGEQRRRLAKIARRRERGIVHAQPTTRRRTSVDLTRQRLRRPWVGYAAWRRLRQAQKDAAGEFVARLTAIREALAARVFSAPRCPWKNVRRTVSGDIAGPDALKAAAMPPCGGRLRKLPMPKEATTQDWRCQSCGRAWQDTREWARGFSGWVEVYR